MRTDSATLFLRIFFPFSLEMLPIDRRSLNRINVTVVLSLLGKDNGSSFFYDEPE